MTSLESAPAGFLSFLLERALYAFLRRALREGSAREPYRGPARFVADRFVYTNSATGEFGSFWGLEQITWSGEVAYELRYAGGFLG